FDIALIQEPYFDFRGVSRATRAFVSIYPTTHTTNQKDTRSMILVNTRLRCSACGPREYNIPPPPL
ncbi:hypothetical protein B0H13DRAFT_1462265, partial [Mycena leptocephala]